MLVNRQSGISCAKAIVGVCNFVLLICFFVRVRSTTHRSRAYEARVSCVKAMHDLFLGIQRVLRIIIYHALFSSSGNSEKYKQQEIHKQCEVLNCAAELAGAED